MCAAAVAVSATYSLGFSKEEIAEFSAQSERYVGVTSGGMDQAISMLGAPGIAQLVEFDPVRASPVPLPDGASFVIVNSLAVSNKAEGATGRYNLRVVECRLAAAALALALGAERGEALALRTLREVEPLVAAKYAGVKGSADAAALAAVDEHLHSGTYSRAELEGLLGCGLADLFPGDPSAARVLAAFDEFKLHDRAAHVFAEAARVPAFREVCLAKGTPAAERMAALGRLMDDSQASCRDLYQCSCPELDQVVALAKRHGAVGSRLTGAGWGGCTVSLVRDEDVPAFLTAVSAMEGWSWGRRKRWKGTQGLRAPLQRRPTCARSVKATSSPHQPHPPTPPGAADGGVCAATDRRGTTDGGDAGRQHLRLQAHLWRRAGRSRVVSHASAGDQARAFFLKSAKTRCLRGRASWLPLGPASLGLTRLPPRPSFTKHCLLEPHIFFRPITLHSPCHHHRLVPAKLALWPLTPGQSRSWVPALGRVPPRKFEIPLGL